MTGLCGGSAEVRFGAVPAAGFRFATGRGAGGGRFTPTMAESSAPTIQRTRPTQPRRRLRCRPLLTWSMVYLLADSGGGSRLGRCSRTDRGTFLLCCFSAKTEAATRDGAGVNGPARSYALAKLRFLTPPVAPNATTWL